MSEVGRVSQGVVGEALEYVGRPALLVEAGGVIARRLREPHQVVASGIEVRYGEWFGYNDYFEYTAGRYEAYTTGDAQEPEVHVGFRRFTAEEKVTDAVCVWRRTNRWPDSEREITQQTRVVFFSKDDDYRMRLFYAASALEPVSEHPVPAGAFVDFSCTEHGIEKARLYGMVRTNGRDKPYFLRGYTDDTSIFPVEHMVFSHPGGKELMVPAEQTLKPQFFLHDIVTK